MKLISLTISDRAETHIIAELKYSVSQFFGEISAYKLKK